MLLKKRIKQLEKLLSAENYTFEFEDSSSLELTNKQFMDLWEDVEQGRPNQHYDLLKEKWESGFEDDAGLIHWMVAVHPKENTNLWDEDKKRLSEQLDEIEG